jgi:hypothetical protein
MLEFVNIHRELHIGLCEIEKVWPSRTAIMYFPAHRYLIHVLFTTSPTRGKVDYFDNDQHLYKAKKHQDVDRLDTKR